MSGPLQVYIAAPYPTRAAAIEIMQTLERQGFAVNSRWLFDAAADDSLAAAREDLEDIARADVLLAINAPDWADRGTGGRHAEFGYALALGIPIVLLGPRSHTFHHLSEVLVVDAADNLPAVLRMAVKAATVMPPLLTATNAVQAVVAEFRRAMAKHAAINSPHEGYAVILEELDELWDEVKADRGRTQAALLEAVQVAAMGLRYLTDLARPS